jgi:hypothetical protein
LCFWTLWGLVSFYAYQPFLSLSLSLSLAALEFELRVSHALGRCSTTWVMPLALYQTFLFHCYLIFFQVVFHLLQRLHISLSFSFWYIIHIL